MCQACDVLNKIRICERIFLPFRSPFTPIDLDCVQGPPYLGWLSQTVRRKNYAHFTRHLPLIVSSYPSTEDQRRVPGIEVGNHPPINWLWGVSQEQSWRIWLRLITDQLASVAGIINAQLYLNSVRCESLEYSSCRRVFERWDISWPATKRFDHRVLHC